MAEVTAYTRNKLVASLLQIKHGDLSLYEPEGLAAAKADADLLGHFIAWNALRGKVRDARVALPVIALRGTQREDRDLAENAVAHLLKLDPRELLRAYTYSTQLSKRGLTITGGHRRLLEVGLRRYLEVREDNARWWDRTVLQHRRPMKFLYRAAHKRPSARAQRILFDEDYPRTSVFATVKALRTMTPREAAGAILQYQIPWEVAVGSVAKAKDREVLLALIEGMTGNQLITNSAMLQRLGVMQDEVLKAAYESALARATSSSKVETLKAGHAAEKLKGTAAGEKLAALQERKSAQMGTIDGDWLVLGDCSASMSTSIEVARQVAAFIAQRVAGAVYLVFFNTQPTFVDVTGLTYQQILEKTRRITPQGGTAIGVGLDYILSRRLVVQGIAVCSDGGENQHPAFAPTYRRYCEQMQVEPTVYHFHVPGDQDVLSLNCRNMGVPLEQFPMGRNVDYYALPNLVETMRVNRYALFDEIMSVELLTIEKALERRPSHERVQAVPA